MNLIVLVAVLMGVVLTGTIFWGWVRWTRRPKSKTVPSILSLMGFALATASALLGASTMLYVLAVGGFRYYDPMLLRVYRWGALLSLLAIVSAVIGVWGPSPLRWHAPVSALGTLALWIVAAAGE